MEYYYKTVRHDTIISYKTAPHNKDWMSKKSDSTRERKTQILTPDLLAKLALFSIEQFFAHELLLSGMVPRIPITLIIAGLSVYQLVIISSPDH